MNFQTLVSQELERARVAYTPITSEHEGFAIICAQLDGFWDEVTKGRNSRCRTKMRDELIKIAAMAQRTAEDVLGVGGIEQREP